MGVVGLYPKETFGKKPMIWRRRFDDIFSFGSRERDLSKVFIEQFHMFYPVISLTVEYSKEEVNFTKLRQHKINRWGT